MEASTKEGCSGHTDSEGDHSVVGRDVGASRSLHGIRSQYSPGTLLQPAKGRDYPGKDDSLLAEGVDALLGRRLGDDEDPGEPAD
jgi:hypothetical protein